MNRAEFLVIELDEDNSIFFEKQRRVLNGKSYCTDFFKEEMIAS
ncbi:hypothetical protein LEP1GSC021_3775 [Leptospira noguchii str. 1993005606]|uniref:Uncharacterized protein n=1 Tax=Leptospira noguchii str. 2007001578 TaxID=1049974 RepID=A0ABP2TET0_9LEPT|nr:hypothetical protein LEP1GSC041_1309 [Leptospira noguchii str. 2006001870]EMN02840.1 hypothetical protein LEP1GSC035_2169 [Leptospira noguchii str. 2007001578]EMO28901.1 hypothetical protein LEP1GSC170_5228 [Leptospira interrogans serovar Bataviae str. HAI135]EMS83459.1 hypothetical protein LEP1GSC074_1332 [Leptospira noguchii str. Hook]EMS90037.1 hypothetical protein LEP1GSC073_0337 [Leptospira noguchii str. Cascata]EPE85387.1 hypothetical protein LEP1GSC021_3775 [Leptospira noguchii str. 